MAINCSAPIKYHYFQSHVAMQDHGAVCTNDLGYPTWGSHGGFYRATKEITVYKKVITSQRGQYVNAIATLVIPVGGLIYCSRTEAKMRADRVVVKAIDAYVDEKAPADLTVSDNTWMVYNLAHMFTDGPHQGGLPSLYDPDAWVSVNEAQSLYDNSFVYTVGRTVVPDDFSTMDIACAGGIHFYIDVRRALEHS